MATVLQPRPPLHILASVHDSVPIGSHPHRSSLQALIMNFKTLKLTNKKLEKQQSIRIEDQPELASPAIKSFFAFAAISQRFGLSIWCPFATKSGFQSNISSKRFLQRNMKIVLSVPSTLHVWVPRVQAFYSDWSKRVKILVHCRTLYTNQISEQSVPLCMFSH